MNFFWVILKLRCNKNRRLQLLRQRNICRRHTWFEDMHLCMKKEKNYFTGNRDVCRGAPGWFFFLPIYWKLFVVVSSKMFMSCHVDVRFHKLWTVLPQCISWSTQSCSFEFFQFRHVVNTRTCKSCHESSRVMLYFMLYNKVTRFRSPLARVRLTEKAGVKKEDLTIWCNERDSRKGDRLREDVPVA